MMEGMIVDFANELFVSGTGEIVLNTLFEG